jgi:hypothetical protein
MANRRVVNVIAHKVCEDGLLYRVQWSTHECEWTFGSSLDLPEISPYLLRYWQTGSREVADKSTQTQPCRFFEFPATPEDIQRATRAFVEFPATGSSTLAEDAVLRSSVPVAIDALDIPGGKATVRFSADSEPAEMDLARLRMLAPRLIAQYFLGPRKSRSDSL